MLGRTTIRGGASLALALGLVLAAAPASAHIHLDAPADMLKQADNGDPQKTGQCGTADPTDPTVASGIVTKIKAGSKYTVKWTDTVTHPGHYRVAIGKSPADFKDPEMDTTGGTCNSATVQDPPVAPVIADGLDVAADTPARLAGGTAHQYELTVPNEPCDHCVLQVIQFMTEHGAPCIYYHCAAIQIVADLPGGPVEVTTPPAGGTSSGSTSGTSTTPPPSGGTSGSAETSTSSSSGGTKRYASTPASDDSGCNVGGQDWTFAPLALAALATLRGMRRRRR
jgi:MYXO-CTERM domain-containing protein